MNLLSNFRDFVLQNHLFTQKDKLLLAVSGGVDSAVLCELCKQAGFNFSIAHCNFKLRESQSDRDEEFVKGLAEKYKVSFYVKQFDTFADSKKNKTSIETTARNLRYRWFEQLSIEYNFNVIVTAHHANDNVETLLMNFFRGTGIKGLHGILLKQQKIIRPLLFAKKNELETFATENKLPFVIDYTNAESDFTRNYFRNELIPALQKVFPSVNDNLLDNIERFKDVEELYTQAISGHKKKLLEYKGSEVHMAVLQLQQTKPLNTVVYEIIKDYGFTTNQTNDVIALLKSESGKYVQSSTHRIIRNRKWLIISPNDTNISETILIERDNTTISFKQGTLQLSAVLNKHLAVNNNQAMAQLDAAEVKFPLLLRKWKQGDYFYPLGMQKKKKLSRFFIDQKLSVTDKQKVWVVESNKKILWVIGLRIDDRFKITVKTKNVLQINLKNLA
jgi:tRNA(Ile)-lysidine synthase